MRDRVQLGLFAKPLSLRLRRVLSNRQSSTLSLIPPLNVVRALGMALFPAVDHHHIRPHTPIPRFYYRAVSQPTIRQYTLRQIDTLSHGAILSETVSFAVSLSLNQ